MNPGFALVLFLRAAIAHRYTCGTDDANTINRKPLSAQPSSGRRLHSVIGVEFETEPENDEGDHPTDW